MLGTVVAVLGVAELWLGTVDAVLGVGWAGFVGFAVVSCALVPTRSQQVLKTFDS